MIPFRPSARGGCHVISRLCEIEGDAGDVHRRIFRRVLRRLGRQRRTAGRSGSLAVDGLNVDVVHCVGSQAGRHVIRRVGRTGCGDDCPVERPAGRIDRHQVVMDQSVLHVLSS